jgi:galactoside O-acetyltransferase
MENPFYHGYYTSEELRGFGFKSVGDNVRIAKNCTIIGLPHISIGDHVRIDDNTAIVAASGEVELGSFIHIGGGCHLSGAGNIRLEDFSGLSQGVRIYSVSDDYSGNTMTNPMVPGQYTGARSSPVRLCRHVIVGSGSVILPGVEIGEGSAVGALSLVRKSLPAWGIYSGSPAKRIAERSKLLLELEKEFLNSPPLGNGG